MTDLPSSPQPEGSHAQEVYSVGYQQEVVDFFGGRRAAKQAAFFLPHLRSGLRLLDCGCGPGSITTDLAEIVEPGETIGVDIELTQVEAARAHATSRGVQNVRFEVGSIYDLPFPAASFDAAFIHGVVEHLQEPVRAFREVRRVLKVGGVLGTRHGDLGGHLLAPMNPLVERFFTLVRFAYQHEGADPDFGRHQLAALHEAGFRRLVASASYDCWAETPVVTERMASMMISHITQSRMATQAIELGLADRADLEESAAAIQAWGRDPTAFAAEAWCEAVAWKE